MNSPDYDDIGLGMREMLAAQRRDRMLSRLKAVGIGSGMHGRKAKQAKKQKRKRLRAHKRHAR